MSGWTKVLMAAVVGVQVLATMLDLVTVSSIPLFIEMAIKPQQVLKYGPIVQAFGLVGVTTPAMMVTWLGIFLVALLVFSGVIKVFVSQAGPRFALTYQIHLLRSSMELLGRLHPSFLGMRGIASIKQNLRAELRGAINGYLVPLMDFWTKTIVTVTAIVALAAIDPLVVLTLGVGFALMYSVVYLVRKQWVNGLAYRNRATYVKAAKLMSEYLKALTSPSRGQNPAEVVDNVEAAQKQYADTLVRISVFNQFPRIAFETIAIGALLVLVLINMQLGDAQRLASVASVLVIAFFRLSGIFQGAFVSFSKAQMNNQFYKEVRRAFQDFQKELDNPTDSTQSTVQLKQELGLVNACALEVAGEEPSELPDFTIVPGEVVAITSALSSARSHFARVLGLQSPLRGGSYRLDGVMYSDSAFLVASKVVALIPRNQPFLKNRPIKEHIFPDYTPEPAQIAQAEELLRALGFSAMPQGLETQGNLQLGREDIPSRRLRLQLALTRSVFSKAPILVFDELDLPSPEFQIANLLPLVQKFAPGKAIAFAVAHTAIPNNTGRVFDLDVAAGTIDLAQRLEARKLAKQMEANQTDLDSDDDDL